MGSITKYSIYSGISTVIVLTPTVVAVNIDSINVWFGVSLSILLSALVIIFGILSFKRRIHTPINSLNEASKKLLNQEFGTRVKTDKYSAEVSLLVNNFNKLAVAFENQENMRKTFVASASHELRSPLTSIQGFLQALLDGTVTELSEREKYLNIVYNETRRLSTLINNMLNLSRMESGNSPILRTKFEINEIIHQVVDRFEPTLSKKQTKVKLEFALNSVFVFADKDKIIQVLVNLIDNAVKYSPDFSEIVINTYTHNKKIYIAIKDNGFGISKKDHNLIWDQFYMADKARTPNKSKGTGLGLSIVKKIMDDHRETIWVESNKGAGATFIFTLNIYNSDKHQLSWGAK
ncbi:MAG: cell wall metabolism sensor histidine kinase WalK [Clostridiales bacterium]|jgi:signal transduction histidine kinase|nr:cell wall metabolism sensor histidine kinase WalK [Clostridiales bacterium]